MSINVKSVIQIPQKGNDANNKTSIICSLMHLLCVTCFIEMPNDGTVAGGFVVMHSKLCNSQ
ncbi:hypothetical protein RG47T_0643 [Mucilaginibacter polytrichastri]|uniref:Uncharacterized protein n=1 Tax=Mucilaginibacter polytrichastri TaxID=1302689 RepID=A0A1Q5ZTU5_9SPHI|nr:hypothetical protein RG47T_0643 [Mucilaginibacter polytrichastri]